MIRVGCRRRSEWSGYEFVASGRYLRLALLTAVLLVAAADPFGRLAAQSQPAVTQLMADSQKAVQEGRYLQAIRLVEKQAFDVQGRPVAGVAYKQWRQLESFVTGEAEPLPPDQLESGAVDAGWAARIKAAEPNDALAEIVARARRTNVVILNEAHDEPRDRAFALEVSRALRPLGYRILAAETFENEGDGPAGQSGIDRLRHDRFVRRSTGFYTLDPVYAGFVRRAMAEGYEPVAYEQTSIQRSAHPTVPGRERDMAENLMDRILRPDPSAKVLIYVGYGHAFETLGQDGLPEAMAGWLKRLSGVDPLTIDQTVVTDRSPGTALTYAAAADRTRGRPTVFLIDGRPLVFGRRPDIADLQVVHPPRAYRLGRPDWLRTLHGRPMRVPRSLLPRSGRRLVQAFAVDAPEDAVPLDQVLVSPGRPAPVLFVDGRVRLAVQDDL